MIRGGNATIYVADINASIRFYTETLGSRPSMRAGDGSPFYLSQVLHVGAHGGPA